jgi:hypothetical protein
VKRTLFYDRETGELLHSHYEVRVVERAGEGGAELSPPAAVSVEDASAELVSRGLDLARVGSVTTSDRPSSSRRTARRVDPTTGRLRTRRLESRTDAEEDE